MIKKSIPSIITLMNLLCGCLSIVSAFKGNLEASAFFIIGASFFDFFDGFFARLLNCKSEFGKQLDSLADVVSFGLAPAVIIFQLMNNSVGMPQITLRGINPLPYMAFIIALFSALRLAKFNIDVRQSDSFIGLPTPANAILIGALPLILWHYSDCNSAIAELVRLIFYNFYFLSGLVILMSYLLIAELPLISFKFKTYTWKENYIKYLFLLFSILLLLILNFIAIPLIIIFYIFLSVIINFTSKKN